MILIIGFIIVVLMMNGMLYGIGVLFFYIVMLGIVMVVVLGVLGGVIMSVFFFLLMVGILLDGGFVSLMIVLYLI